MSFHTKQRKVKLFFYRNDVWLHLLTGCMYLISSQNPIIKIIVDEFSQNYADFMHSLQVEVVDEVTTLTIHSQLIQHSQKASDQLIYLQIKGLEQALSISFLLADYCDLIWDQVFLNKQQDNDKTWTKQTLLLISQELKQSLLYIDFFFGNTQKIEEFCDFFKQLKEQNDQEMLDLVFPVVKLVFLRAEKSIIQIVMKMPYFQTILECLSLNPFIEGKHNYIKAYNSMTNIANVLRIEDKSILEAYKMNTRIKFIKDIAICMFTQPQTDMVLNNLMVQNNILILDKISKSVEILMKIKQMATQDACSYFLTFTQLWEIFQSVPDSFQNQSLRKCFFQLCIQLHFDYLSIKSGYQLAEQFQGKQSSPSDFRIFERWGQSIMKMFLFKPNQCQDNFLSHAQNQDQLENSKTIFSIQNFGGYIGQHHLLKTFSKIVQIGPYCTKLSILEIIRSFLDPSKCTITSKFRFYIYEQFIRKTYKDYSAKDVLSNYVDFLIEIFESHPIRTRRIIIETGILIEISKHFKKDKHIFLLGLKFLKKILEKQDEGIQFIFYLQNHKIYEDVAELYAQSQTSKKKKSILNSAFLNLFKFFMHHTKNPLMMKYFSKIFKLDEQQKPLQQVQHSKQQPNKFLQS